LRRAGRERLTQIPSPAEPVAAHDEWQDGTRQTRPPGPPEAVACGPSLTAAAVADVELWLSATCASWKNLLIRRLISRWNRTESVKTKITREEVIDEVIVSAFRMKAARWNCLFAKARFTAWRFRPFDAYP